MTELSASNPTPRDGNQPRKEPGKVIGEIKFYRSDAPYFAFTNFSEHPITVDGVTWKTTEHFFQAQKFIKSDPAWAEKIRAADTPLQAAGMGRNIHHPIRENWDDVKDAVMRFAVLTKVLTHPEVRDLLCSTGVDRLLEDSPTDYYWGIGREGGGKNRLGEILMEIRTLLAAPDWQRATKEYGALNKASVL
jgi:ribA/ribD-fused uncharacterized protein